ncbi:aldo/keto reductase [Actinoplanes teichomyceticus]|uniref:Aryl-alcohol dehydrogenase-like predicted oxidoreductase n=1 Tax=Actinoplanes teichomyceticus TaxID=1867 RepID=A0A561WI44_ACTTI|nr:aldo/keto reductase [Actinoplanes teichomyceticus]TWG23531.1 aryl-alcohol dehydrogenase-like predicted oxidoreductase [Actinoplanes teichomyceticus]GIF16155.1 oxidoreductase [Actinoplanes teichomyceticus]
MAGTWRLGDRTVNRMGLGSMRLTANPDTGVAIRVLRRAVELGVDHIDTAAFYRTPGGIIDAGPGPVRHATELIRAALRPYPNRVFIATKVGPDRRPDGRWAEADTPARLRRQVEENLRRLGVTTLDLVNLRITRQIPAQALAERFGALADLRAAGLIRHLGLSNITAEQLDVAAPIAPVVCVQNAYSVDLRRDDDLLRICRERGIAFVPFFAIAGRQREAGAAGEQSGALRRVAARHGVTEHQVRLAWTLHRGPHVLAIPGTGDPAHLEQNIAAAGLALTGADLAEIDAAG